MHDGPSAPAGGALLRLGVSDVMRSGWRLVCVGAALAAAILLAGPAGTAPGGSAPASGARGSVISAGSQDGQDYALTVAIQRDGKIVAAGESIGGCAEGSCISWGGVALARYRPNGRLDTSFGRAGRVLTELGEDDAAFAVAVQADGRIVVAGGGGWSGVTLIRYTRGGRLDSRFGNGGIAQPALRDECGEWARALAIQRDGKIVVAGECLANEEEWQKGLLARYTPQGRVDRAFGDGGSVLTSFGPGENTSARGVAIQADGRIVIGGASEAVLGENQGFALARYMPDGQLDASFGSAGTVLDVPGAAFALALQPDGKIVAAGAGVARYAPHGSPDSSFGGDGKVPTDLGVSGVVIQTDGKIVVAGSIARGRRTDVAVRRYLSDGTPDAEFGSGGRVITDFGAFWDSAREVALQSDGRIVVAGTSEPSVLASAFALARYTTSGRLDRGFGKGGKVRTVFDVGVTGFASFSAKRQKQGVLVRWRTTSEVGVRGFHIYRDGTLVRVTRRLIASKGSATRGASYAFRDRRAPKAPRRYSYGLVEVTRDGRTIYRGQAVVKR